MNKPPPYTHPVEFGGEVTKATKTEHGILVRITAGSKSFLTFIPSTVLQHLGYTVDVGVNLRVRAAPVRGENKWVVPEPCAKDDPTEHSRTYVRKSG